MTNLIAKRLSTVAFCALLFACTQEEDAALVPETTERAIAAAPGFAAAANSNIMMQAFYWDVPMGGTWWNNVASKAPLWADVGITSLWFPPPSKGESGPYSVGYDPFDYFDFGNFDQQGTVETRYGSKAELQASINAAHAAGLEVYADIVMNHNGGGTTEFNPNTGGNTNTSFLPASGIFPRGHNDFHPSSFEQSDAGVFKEYPDLVHKNPWVAGGLWENDNSVAKYYKNELGFDGWRFDWVDGYGPEYVKKFVDAAPGFAVTEYWGPSGGLSVGEVQSYINASGQASFDFPCAKAMASAFGNNNLAELNDRDMLCKSNPDKAVTFVANHDIDEIPDNKKLLAYAFIMAREGIPCLFYSDYEDRLDKDKMNTLIWIKKSLASGRTSVLHADNDEYIAQMDGSPGLLIYINNSGSAQSRTVTTKWANSTLHDFANNDPSDKASDGAGVATLTAPANSYTIWSSDGVAPLPASSKTITLRMQKNVLSGNSLFFTGDQPPLTSWGGGIGGNWNDGNYWTTSLTLPGSVTTVTWKVRKGETNGAGDVWESGNNHVISNPVDGETYTATFNGGF